MLTGRADARLEHQVKLLGLANIVVRVGILDVVGSAELTKFGARVVVKLEDDL